jgi:hypothetical protein
MGRNLYLAEVLKKGRNFRIRINNILSYLNRCINSEMLTKGIIAGNTFQYHRWFAYGHYKIPQLISSKI